MPTLDKTIAQLNHLLATCHCGQVAYQDFAKTTKAEDIRDLFTSLALELPMLSDQLRRQIGSYGGRPIQHLTAGGMLYCGWQRLKSLLGWMDDRALLNEGLRVEISISRRFESLLQAELPPLFREQLIAQYDALLDRQAQLHKLLAK